MVMAPIIRGLTKAAKTATKAVPTHGTFVENLDGILKKGLRRGSALDITPNKEWAKEYPVLLDVPSARPGRFIEHNKFYESANTALPSKVTVDLSQYTDIGAEEALGTINRLKKEHPKIKWYVKGQKALEDPNTLTKKNLVDYYIKEHGVSLEEAEELVRSELSDINNRVPQHMLGYKKGIYDMKSYKDYFNWLMKQGELE
jgi:hypothetical protein